MTPLRIPYYEARTLIKPGDHLFTAEPGVGSRLIRWATGEEWSHVAFVVTGPRDEFGMVRHYVEESHAKRGVTKTLASEWIAARRGRVGWIQAPLSPGERALWDAAASKWIGADYEGLFGFVREGLGLGTDDLRPGDHDKICSALSAAVWREVTGRAIPGYPWLSAHRALCRLIRHTPRGPFVPTPGAVARYLVANGGTAWEVERDKRTGGR